MCEFHESEAALDRLVRNNKNSVWTRNQSGLLAKSKALFSKTYQSRRYHVETHMNIARDIFTGLVKEKTDAAIFHYNLGVTLHALGQDQEGNAAFAKAKELNWKSSDLSDDELDNASCKLGLLGRDPASCTAEEEIRCPTG